MKLNFKKRKGDKKKMLKEIRSNIEDKKIKFALMNSQNAIGLNDLPDGTELTINGYVIFHIVKDLVDETDEDIENREFDSIALRGLDNTIYATRSKAVIRFIEDMEDNGFTDELKESVTLIKGTRQTRNGYKTVVVSLKI